ncbi:MAG: DUF3422 domain-containing protein [Dokdonella sp.]|uniref:DUF3422 family protein n=1 Tax=Dokdonella sp. TaxID=2291710 RepID=UPI00326744F5
MSTPSMMLGPQHPSRREISEEVHARPSDSLEAPSRATYVAVLIPPADRKREIEHLADLCSRFAVDPPDTASSHFTARLGGLTIKWERHGEFSGYTVVVPGVGATPFDQPAAALLPAGWLAGIPGLTLVAAHAELIAASTSTADAVLLARYFDDNITAGGSVGEGVGAIFSDFKIHADGFSRVLLLDDGYTARQAGRMMQRIFEIETYRMMALLALPVARHYIAKLAEMEAELATVTDDIAARTGDDETLLQLVTRLAAEVERGLAASQFRFRACSAYANIVNARISELRERRLPGVQPIGEFMTRRFTPAVATCATVLDRLYGLSERVARASALLSTRVDIARERQNHMLLGSMDQRAKMQLRLQETVEGLSVIAIVYYAASVVGLIAKSLKSGGLHVDPELIVGASIPVLAALVILATRAARRRASSD